MNVILIGMPASGKTTVSQILAAKLSRELIDTDAEIVKKYGSINEIFNNFGEEYFRELETQVVAAVSNRQNAVISTGGGCVLRAQNAECFKKSGKIFYLKASLPELIKRLKDDDSRPLLAGDMQKKLFELEQKRAEVYQRVADFTVETDGLTAEEVAKEIISVIDKIKTCK